MHLQLRHPTIKGLAIHPDKRVEEVTLRRLEDYQGAIGGLIEPIMLKDGSTMYVDDEFLSRKLDEFNSVAGDVAGLGGRPDVMLSGILGPVVIVGPLDQHGYDTDVTDLARRWVERVRREAVLTIYSVNGSYSRIP